ncbi:MAG: pyrroline-5-carboxylate reductase, partial [Armatimonadota bacterium]|nr:pyrroline-5-carboxylate reductase [Armatimonadota bacterium]
MLSEERAYAIAVVGAGFMGEALLRGILAAGLYRPDEVVASDVNASRLQELCGELGFRTAPDNSAAARAAAVVLLAVKPQVLPGVLAEVRNAIGPGQLVISIAAGVSLATLEEGLSPGVAVVRAMPNMPATVGAGVTAIAGGRWAGADHLDVAEALFNAVGTVVRVEERYLNAVTALSGSGPAYICLVIEALADAGVHAGLPRDAALRLAAQTVAGTGRLILQTARHPAQVKDQVCSPGGTTIA